MKLTEWFNITIFKYKTMLKKQQSIDQTAKNQTFVNFKFN